jgi:acylphosphatase
VRVSGIVKQLEDQVVAIVAQTAEAGVARVQQLVQQRDAALAEAEQLRAAASEAATTIAALQQQCAFEYSMQRAAWQVIENLVGEIPEDARSAVEAKVRAWFRELAPHQGNVVPVDVQLARHEQIGKVAGLVLATNAAANIARQERARFNLPAADALLKLSGVFALLRGKVERGGPLEVPAPDA